MGTLMNESDKKMDEELDRLLAWLQVDTAELPTPDPGLPARIRVLAVHTNATAHERPRRWVLASLAVATLDSLMRVDISIAVKRSAAARK